MRTTLTIDDDVLLAVRALAERENKSLGEVLSALARQALRREAPTARLRNGVPLLTPRSGSEPVTPDLVRQLRDETR